MVVERETQFFAGSLAFGGAGSAFVGEVGARTGHVGACSADFKTQEERVGHDCGEREQQYSVYPVLFCSMPDTSISIMARTHADSFCALMKSGLGKKGSMAQRIR